MPGDAPPLAGRPAKSAARWEGTSGRVYDVPPSTEAPRQRPRSQPLEKPFFVQLCTEPQPMLRAGAQACGSPYPQLRRKSPSAPRYFLPRCRTVSHHNKLLFLPPSALSFLLHPVCFIQITFCWAALFPF